jgi:pimeloyl-ACP methyl ester carboxylesterase
VFICVHLWFQSLFFLIPATVHAATTIPNGKWSFIFTDAKGRGGEAPMRVYTYKPKGCDEKCPIQFVLHGMTRNASDYRDYWEIAADNYKLVIVAPEFSQNHWKGSAGYNLGNVENGDREKWGYSAIEHLFDEVREGRTEYRIFGHSAGGQFVHRMMFFRPDNRASVAVAANPGWYMFPEFRKDRPADAYPYSLVGAKVGEPELRKALERRFVLMVGEKDTDAEHKALENTEEAKKQGANRLERAENYFMAATTISRDLGVKMNWDLVEVPGVAHSGKGMSRFAADTLYGKK